MSNIVVKVMLAMCNHYPEFALYFHTHYAVVKEEPETLMPNFDKMGNPSFTEDYAIFRKKITTEDKKEYYKKDMELWKKHVENEIRNDGKS